jgi:hypothetical protein
MRNALLLALLCASALTGCTTFKMTAPDSMVVLNEPEYSNYQWRSTTPDGVILAVKVIEQSKEEGKNPSGTLDFWTEAIRLRLRTQSGYALTGETDVTAKTGEKGKQLRFGRDDNGTPHVYWVTLFRTKRFVHVVEAGGKRDLFEKQQKAIEAAIADYEVVR